MAVGLFLRTVSCAYGVILCCLLFFAGGHGVDGAAYNYNASTECLAEPQRVQYKGGKLRNPKFELGLDGWTSYAGASLEVRRTFSGNNFMVAYNRSQNNETFSQQVYMDKGKYYTFSAWVRVSEGSETTVSAVITTPGNSMRVIASGNAYPGCWTMLKGGFQPEFSLLTDLHFLCYNKTVEFWVDNVSLKEFNQTEWRVHQQRAIRRVRQRKILLQITDKLARPIRGVKVNIKFRKPVFHVGCGVTDTFVKYKKYQEWFLEKGFTASVFTNQMKWYWTESRQGIENYTIPDAMFQFFKDHGIAIRGHNVLWDKPNMNQLWLHAMTPKELLATAVRRLASVMARYFNDIFEWDVVNENLHFHFFEDKIGPQASGMFYHIAHVIDPNATLYLNEFNTLEIPGDIYASPHKYIKKFREIRSYPGNENLTIGFGLQAHFPSGKPNMPYIRAVFDFLSETKMPIWLTEMDVQNTTNQAVYLEEIMREAFAHPGVEGMIVWAPWKPGANCTGLCLTDDNFKNTRAGDVVDKLMAEWKTPELNGKTNSKGLYKYYGFLGDYTVTLYDPYSLKQIIREIKITNKDQNPVLIPISI
nr:PREDICTED: endo-1,4-beta-xylanase A-like [Nicotiana tabacum]